MYADSTNDKQYSRFSSAIIFVVLVWIISLVQFTGVFSAWIPMLLPRSLVGLPGILTMPFLHGGFVHLLSNTPPLLIFAALVSLRGNAYFIKVTVFIMLLSGLMLWGVGRGTYHIGASALIFGYFSFLIMRTFYMPSISAVLISIGVAVSYAGMIWGVLPQGNHISWEGHLCGLIAGGLIAKYMRHHRSR